jgi:hypothetical protein
MTARVRVLAALLAAASMLAVALPARAAVDATSQPPSPPRLAATWQAAQADLAQARADQAALVAPTTSTDLLVVARHALAVADADYRFRSAARTEQVVAYAIAVNPNVESAVAGRLGRADLAPLQAAVEGLRALWRAAGIDDLSLIQVRHTRAYLAPATASDLLAYYRAAGSRYAIDWTYLASINFIESDFGRVLGPSSAGALGPMQFMPGTWLDYGNGGDVMSPRDSIEAAARYLRAMGGPANMSRAIYRYNNDSDYVASVQAFAAAFRADPLWVDRMYYWSTAG